MTTASHRVVLHVDMDAFFVSVELRRRPELRGKPVVVGGDGRRGVVAAASYEARQYGVFSAMPSAVARRRCPDAVFLAGDHALYAQVSTQVRAVFDRYTPLVEPLSLDEAFLDVSGVIRLFGDGVTIGQRIRADIRAELELGCSVGVAPNKFLAKLASVEAKPRPDADRVRAGPGVVEVRPGDELAFLHPLPVKRLWGVGPKTLEKLERVGVRTVADLAELDETTVIAALGEGSGRHLIELSHGRDDRPVTSERDVKSISHEETYEHNRHTVDELDTELVRLADAVAQRLRRAALAARTLAIKVRFDDGFRTITRSTTLPYGVDNGPDIVAALRPILAAVDPSAGVRLFGVAASKLGAPERQLTLDDSGPDHRASTEALDSIRARFGDRAIGPASAVRHRKLRVVERGAQQWGPTGDPRADD